MKKILLISTILSLLALNVATLISATTHNTLYDSLSRLPIVALFNNGNGIVEKYKVLKQEGKALAAEQSQIIARNKALSKEKDKMMAKIKALMEKQSKIENENKMLAQERKQITTKNETLVDKNKGLSANIYYLEQSGINKKIRTEITAVIERIRHRIRKATVLNINSMPAESVPNLGIFTIVSTTAAEVYLSCKNAHDLKIIGAIIDPDNFTVRHNQGCELERPTVKELQRKVKELWLHE
ncbi:MAG: hypothetical protein Ctma_1336 [Catillopecten margaritatus gill symbiont]|uniref:Uncharacterized protein n=1 Tax=Catillopecten margaritatus gill symbiont TaxID=3083288 RepID=A0AAU6PHW6_9GAMM